MVEVFAVVEMAQDEEFNNSADGGGSRHTGRHGQKKGAGMGGDSRCHIGPDHIKGAMGQVDDLHDAEYQGQAGRHEKQGDSQLQAVEKLFDYQEHKNGGVDTPPGFLLIGIIV